MMQSLWSEFRRTTAKLHQNLIRKSVTCSLHVIGAGYLNLSALPTWSIACQISATAAAAACGSVLLLMKFCNPTASPASTVGSVSMITWGVFLFTPCNVCLADHLQGMNKLRQSLMPKLASDIYAKIFLLNKILNSVQSCLTDIKYLFLLHLLHLKSHFLWAKRGQMKWNIAVQCDYQANRSRFHMQYEPNVHRIRIGRFVALPFHTCIPFTPTGDYSCHPCYRY